MGNITDAVLASSLKELIANDIVIRKSYDEIPPRVEYTLSEKECRLFRFYIVSVNGRGFLQGRYRNMVIHCQKCDYL